MCHCHWKWQLHRINCQDLPFRLVWAVVEAIPHIWNKNLPKHFSNRYLSNFVKVMLVIAIESDSYTLSAAKACLLDWFGQQCRWYIGDPSLLKSKFTWTFYSWYLSNFVTVTHVTYIIVIVTESDTCTESTAKISLLGWFGHQCRGDTLAIPHFWNKN
jgi:hypothetical protein